MPDDSSKTAGDEPAQQLISLAEAAEISGLSHSHLRLLARQRQLDAVKIGRDWLTTKDAVKAYLKTERRTGPKTKDSNGPE